MKKILLLIISLSGLLKANLLPNDKNITLFNLAMVEASNNNYIPALQDLKQIKSDNKIIIKKVNYYKNLFTYLEYKRTNIYKRELAKNLNVFLKNGVKNEEILIIYMKTLIELKKINEEYNIKKHFEYISKFNIKNSKNETKILYTTILIYLKKYKEAINIYKSTLNYNIDFLSILYILDKDYMKASRLFNQMKESNLNKYIKLFVYIKTKQISNILAILNDKNIGDILKYKKLYPIKLKEKKTFYSYKEKKNELMKLKNINNSIFFDFLIINAPLLNTKSLKYISSKDVVNGINKKIILNKYNKMKNNLIHIKKKNIYERIKVYKIKIQNTNNINSYDLYNIGLLYSQIRNYEKAYEYFYKSFFKNPDLVLSGLFLSFISKYKLKKNHYKTDMIVKNIIFKNKNNKYRKISKFLFDFFYLNNHNIKKEQYNLEDKFINFGVNYVYFLKTKNPNYLKKIILLNKSNEFIYKLYRNIYNTRYAFTSYLQDNLEINQNLYQNEPVIIGDLYVLMLEAIGKTKYIKKIGFDTDKTPTYLRHYSFLKIYEKKYEIADSILNYLSSEYKMNDKDYFINYLISKINLKQENEKRILILNGVNYLKTDDLNLIKCFLYFNKEKINIFKNLIQKPINDKIISIEIKNIENILIGDNNEQ